MLLKNIACVLGIYFQIHCHMFCFHKCTPEILHVKCVWLKFKLDISLCVFFNIIFAYLSTIFFHKYLASDFYESKIFQVLLKTKFSPSRNSFIFKFFKGKELSEYQFNKPLLPSASIVKHSCVRVCGCGCGCGQVGGCGGGCMCL